MIKSVSIIWSIPNWCSVCIWIWFREYKKRTTNFTYPKWIAEHLFALFIDLTFLSLFWRYSYEMKIGLFVWLFSALFYWCPVIVKRCVFGVKGSRTSRLSHVELEFKWKILSLGILSHVRVGAELVHICFLFTPIVVKYFVPISAFSCWFRYYPNGWEMEHQFHYNFLRLTTTFWLYWKFIRVLIKHKTSKLLFFQVKSCNRAIVGYFGVLSSSWNNKLSM